MEIRHLVSRRKIGRMVGTNVARGASGQAGRKQTMLANKAALITGSVDGIGFAIAEQLAAQGCAVMLNGLAPTEHIEKQMSVLRARRATVEYHGADLSVPDQIDDMVAQTRQRFGRIDIVVNNAVTRTYANIEDLPIEAWNYALAVNLSAPFHIVRRVMPQLKQRRWGRVINIASNYALRGTARRSDYCSTKHGLLGLTRVIALEGLDFGITCNAICPGATLTPHARKLVAQRMAASGKSEEEATRDYLAQRQPSKRFVDPADVGHLAVFLCSDAAKEITGGPVAIDGGWLAYS
jgi:3-hydroxybutyrate dehydrogenase